jgi:hypothetical protein
MRRYAWFLILVLTIGFGVPLSFGGTQEKPPRKTKLPAPQNVSCTVAGGEVQVGWTMVPDAATYQVEYMGTLTDGVIDKESDYAAAAPYAIQTEEYTALIVHVRALPPPKKEGKAQSGAPKGQWSIPCVAAIPYVDPR